VIYSEAMATINGTDQSETLNGTENNDGICPGNGNDTVYGGDGDDWINGYINDEGKPLYDVNNIIHCGRIKLAGHQSGKWEP